jgi:hypothetical protein
MFLEKKKCRCCYHSLFHRKGYASIAQFFLLYGLHIKNVESFQITEEGLSNCSIAYGMCEYCSFIAPWPEISNDSLLDYYHFYASDSYRQGRLKFENYYKKISQVHLTSEEQKLRRESYQIFFSNEVESLLPKNPSTLDFGGGALNEASVIPNLPKELINYYHFPSDQVYSSSNELINDGKNYDYIQILHVLEHTGHPRNTLLSAVKKLKNSGFVYIEVPLEIKNKKKAGRGGETIKKFHEHINKFCIKSIEALVVSCNLNPILVEESTMPLLTSQNPVPIIRCIAKRR